MRILWIESDAVLSKQQMKRLAAYDYSVDIVSDEQEVVYLTTEGHYELAVYDLSFGRKVDWKVLDQMLEADVPVVMVVDKKDAQQKIASLEKGVDEVITRPLSGEEFVARMRAVIRRRRQPSQDLLESSGLVLDESRYEVMNEQQDVISLTRTELVLLRYLMMNPNKAISKQVLTKVLYQSGQEKLSNVVEVYIRMLRKKLGRDRIRTIWGRGYLLSTAKGPASKHGSETPGILPR